MISVFFVIPMNVENSIKDHGRRLTVGFDTSTDAL